MSTNTFSRPSLGDTQIETAFTATHRTSLPRLAPGSSTASHVGTGDSSLDASRGAPQDAHHGATVSSVWQRRTLTKAEALRRVAVARARNASRPPVQPRDSFASSVTSDDGLSAFVGHTTFLPPAAVSAEDDGSFGPASFGIGSPPERSFTPPPPNATATPLDATAR
uniref:Uncharacterized protein n=1 Tax=Neobodo designis TaxID=312471 RepID=A0A7S1W206_NEODS|mmetsp:Transcript_49651/g.153352  ORF Transcript_49651/g.153352 Transcript_49651/m.153352 type:complete len:167 (+) Transcript_49651:34-534(+)